MSRKPITIIIVALSLLIGAVAFQFLFSNFYFLNSSPDASAANGPRAGLVGYWTMDANDINGNAVYDKSGQGNHGTLVGVSTITAGKIGQARNFVAVSGDYMNTNDQTKLDAGTGSITVSAWAKTTNGSNYITIFGNNWAASTGVILRKTDTNKLEFFAKVSGVGCGPAGSTNINDGKWHHLTGVLDRSGGNCYVYVDGQQNGQDVNTGVNLDANQNYFIGALNSGAASSHWNGSIDDVRIYNRALSAQEVSQLYSSAKINYTTIAPENNGSGRQLVGHWTMDANDINGTTYLDKSGNNNHATSTGSPTITAGKINQALGLNSTTQFLNAGSGASLNLTNNFSISAWVKTNSIGAIQMIVNKSGGSFTDSQYELRLSASGVPNFTATNGTSAFTASHNILKINQWYHLVGVMNNKVMNIYVDGAVGTSATLTGTQSTNLLNTFIGRGGGLYVGNYFFSGALDDVRVYNYALSAQEVSQLYNSAKTSYMILPTTTGLVGYWTMDTNDMGLTGATIYDKSGQRNHGTVTGTTTTTGRIGQARSFNGGTVNKIVTPNMDISAAGGTVSIWFKANVIGNIMMSKSGTNNTYIYQSTATNIVVQTDVVSTAKNFTVSTMSTGIWYHLVVTRNSNTTRVYLNGVESTSGGQAQTDVMIFNQIGKYGESAILWWNGSIDDVRIYNRALTAQEISNLYNSAKVNYVQ